MKIPLSLCLAAAFATRAFAQPATTATLRVTVLDSSHAIIVGATVTVTGADLAPRAQRVPVAKTEDSGIATLTGLVPGRYTTEWFTATRPGEYHLFCAEYCGAQHSGMIGRVVVMEKGRVAAAGDIGDLSDAMVHRHMAV